MAEITEIKASDVRLLVESCRRNSMNAVDTHKFVTTAWGNECISLRSVYRLMSELESGKRDSFEDSGRAGRPKSVATADNIEIIRSLLEQYPHSSIDDLQDATELSHGAVQRIVSEELRMKKILSRWIPHFLSDDNKLSRVTEGQHIANYIRRHRDVQQRLVFIDEKWLFHRTIGTKQSNSVWQSADAAVNAPTMCRRMQHDKKT